jgi:hypothetical protein
MKRLIIAVVAVAAIGSGAFSREFATAMHPRHDEVMPYQAHYANVSTLPAAADTPHMKSTRLTCAPSIPISLVRKTER